MINVNDLEEEEGDVEEMLDSLIPWGLYENGKRCPRCKKAFKSWLGYNKHCARCVGNIQDLGGYSLGIAYTWVLLVVSLGVITVLYVAFSLPIDYIYDITMGQWMQPNPDIFPQSRLDTLNWMINMWFLLPVIIMFSFIIYGLVRTLQEKQYR